MGEPKSRYGRWAAENRDKARAASLRHYHANREKINARATHKNRKRKFGITQEQYEALLEAQNHKCAICANPEVATRNGKLKSLAVDHDHRTSRIRGLLCMACNTMLGNSRESPLTLCAAILYLERSSADLGDGQVSGLPEHVLAPVLYEGLMKRFTYGN